ncbi:DUF368 domain-containing protein [Georgenia deserti]|uniref:DUF368 domain-containing protein n=1 Tax=Georgenia deserti TaxID=2093781 RepID=A0ABW4L687_9MICO
MTSTPSRARTGALPLHLVRGFLIGLAELLPGISGGTIALITGVYEQLINSAGHVLGAVRRLVTGPDRAAGFRAELARTDWWLVVPVLIGMATAVLTVAGTAEHLVAEHTELARGLFFGLVAASLVVPIRLLPREDRTAATTVRDVLAVVVAAVVAFMLVGMAAGGSESAPATPAVFLAAMVAICALVVPGVSGSFFLLAIGLYSPTLQAVDQRDLGYLAVFAAGALIGLVSIVQVLRYLLRTRRRVTLLAMAGLMLGSLRALWPWQSAPESESGPGALIAPYEPIAGPVLFAVLGAAVVLILITVENRMAKRS